MARIWIVEDDPQIGLLIELTVKKAGHGRGGWWTAWSWSAPCKRTRRSFFCSI